MSVVGIPDSLTSGLDSCSIRPPLPEPRGAISAALFEWMRRSSSMATTQHQRLTTRSSEPLDIGLIDLVKAECARVSDPLADTDLQLALYCCYELSYRGFQSIDESLELSPTLFHCRSQLESRFIEALEHEVSVPEVQGTTAGRRLGDLISRFEGPSLSLYLSTVGTSEELNEFLIHRSAYQLKEADPHSWAIPRLSGAPKSALVEIQFDEYGNGEPGRSHAELYAKTLCSAGLSSDYGYYLDRLPGITLATTNLITLFGLRRMFLPSLIGHLAVFEMTSTVPMARYAKAMRRHGYAESGVRFYDVHVIADVEHERVAQLELVDPYLRAEPSMEPLLLWGAQCLMHVEGRFAGHLLNSWSQNRSSLLSDPML